MKNKKGGSILLMPDSYYISTMYEYETGKISRSIPMDNVLPISNGDYQHRLKAMHYPIQMKVKNKISPLIKVHKIHCKLITIFYHLILRKVIGMKSMIANMMKGTANRWLGFEFKVGV